MELTHDESHDGDDFDARKDEFAFAINAGAKHIDDDNDDKADGDPQCVTEMKWSGFVWNDSLGTYLILSSIQ